MTYIKHEDTNTRYLTASIMLGRGEQLQVHAGGKTFHIYADSLGRIEVRAIHQLMLLPYDDCSVIIQQVDKPAHNSESNGR